MTRRCNNCGAAFEPAAHYHRLCWPCWRAERDQATRDDAYRDGYTDGVRDACASSLRNPPGRLSPELLREAVSLTHPDRHPPERAEQATRVTAELLDLRERTKAA